MKPWRHLSVRIFFLQNPEHVHDFRYGRHVTVTLETFGAKKILIAPEVRKIFIQFLFEFYSILFSFTTVLEFLVKIVGFASPEILISSNICIALELNV